MAKVIAGMTMSLDGFVADESTDQESQILVVRSGSGQPVINVVGPES